MIEFAWPWVFVVLPLPLLVRRLMPATSTDKDAALRVPRLDYFAEHSTTTSRVMSNKVMLALAAVAWLLLVIAASRPQWLGDEVNIPISGRDLMLAVDLSVSMKEKDFEINNTVVDRLTAAKQVASEFIEQRKGDRIGLILFGEKAYIQTPLTFDLDTVNRLLDEAVIGLAGKSTAIGDAIGLAIKRLQDTSKNSRVLVLMTDGENTAGELEPLQAAKLAADNDLKIYTIGIGAEYITQQSLFFQRQVRNTELDEKTLTAIADITSGQYFRAKNFDELNRIYDELDKLEPIEQEHETFRPRSALFYWPLGIAMMLATLITLVKISGRSA